MDSNTFLISHRCLQQLPPGLFLLMTTPSLKYVSALTSYNGFEVDDCVRHFSVTGVCYGYQLAFPEVTNPYWLKIELFKRSNEFKVKICFLQVPLIIAKTLNDIKFSETDRDECMQLLTSLSMSLLEF